MIVAFDVDGTLRDYNNRPRYEIHDILRAFKQMGWTVWVWSGGGVNHAEFAVSYMHLSEWVDWMGAKSGAPGVPDLTFDDMEVSLGKINVRVPVFVEGEPVLFGDW